MTTLIDDEGQGGTDPLHLAAELTVAWLGNHGTRAKAEEMPGFLRVMHETVLYRPARARSSRSRPRHPRTTRAR